MAWWGDYERTQPRAVKGGIKAQNVRGASWWGKRWIETLDSFGLGARLSRGRSYARQGQVLSIEVSPGHVVARVQGSRPKPYSVTIEVQPLAPAEREQVRAAIREQPLLAAKLLAGEMPNEIEEVFRRAGVSLFPKASGDLKTECSCPDWSNPCKHVAAVYILLGEEFDRDPFLIFRLRGMERDALLEGFVGAAQDAGPIAAPPDPLPADPALYWNGDPAPVTAGGLYGDVRTPPVSAPLVKRLGRFPFWRGEQELLDILSPVYDVASTRATEAFLGNRGVADRR
jgi:uncharacterized Zn finger protein